MHTLILSDREVRTIRHALQSFIDDEAEALVQILESIKENGKFDPDEIISYGVEIGSANDLMNQLPKPPEL